MAKASDNVFPKVITGMQTSDPAAPSDSSWKLYSKAGGIYARSSNSVVGPFGASGSGLTDPMTTRGDIIIRNSSNVSARLAVGSANKVLTSDGTDVSWGSPAVVKIAESLLGSDTASFDFTSIPSTYRALELHCYWRGTKSATVDQVYMKLNNDGTSAWDWEYWEAVNATTTAAPSVAATFYCANVTAATGPANYFSGARILIPNYALTTGYKTVISNFSEIRNTTDQIGSGQMTAFWRSTAAVDRVTLTPGTGNFKTGSLVTLYGYM